MVETTTVTMKNSQYSPRNITVDAGSTVTWTNEDSSEHTVTNASDDWKKDVEVGGDESTSHTFTQSGVYDVYCRYHGSADSLSGMSMKIAVGNTSINDPLGGSGGGGGSGGY
ncbi:cupredoxin domain-containing protein [Halopenitus sp. POP-27]|uniref:cupredoxin domain-containing protein n=1 Tax=Halopenitus sp. POP-27 TaxID=2994425 RepID=UPI002468A9F3|nr:cupredoxin domain-containing protein [Halopenitus sp. POP-27]